MILVSDLQLFKGMNPAAVSALADASVRTWYPKGALIVAGGAPCPYIGSVLSGELLVILDDTAVVLKRGSYFGLTSGRADGHVVARRNTELVMTRRWEYWELGGALIYRETSSAYAKLNLTRGFSSSNDLLHTWLRLGAGAHYYRSALDVGTGRGEMATIAGWLSDILFITDPSVTSLAVAKAALNAKGIDGVEAVYARSEELPFASASFDLVTCRLSAHHFDSIETALSEMARVLRPGGDLILFDLSSDDALEARALDEFERSRDPSHRKVLSLEEWTLTLTNVGLEIMETVRFEKRESVRSWIKRGGFSNIDEDALEAFLSLERGGFSRSRDTAFLSKRAWFRCRKPQRGLSKIQ